MTSFKDLTFSLTFNSVNFAQTPYSTDMTLYCFFALTFTPKERNEKEL
jgi:hypothetical protein